MRILIMTAIMAVALPFMALGQTSEEPQQTQGQTKDTQTTAPAKGKKMRAGQEQTQPQAKPETGTNVRGQSNVKDLDRTRAREQLTGAASDSQKRPTRAEPGRDWQMPLVSTGEKAPNSSS